MKVSTEKYEKRCHQFLSNDEISKKHNKNFKECDNKYRKRDTYSCHTCMMTRIGIVE
jgi:hypothetical protein